ncbi:MAG: hypothetical protein AMJ93_09515 [Anaerolineae bacterium SM23_84]|nr:MAG: hypothetical protein AMJ93_09515 [Anaerolineae bacterium SM23_84]
MTLQPTTEVEIFTKPGCPYSRALKRKLLRESTAFVEHNGQTDPTALRRMLNRSASAFTVHERCSEAAVGWSGWSAECAEILCVFPGYQQARWTKTLRRDR